jgi:tetrathionate reductase subunit B
MSVEDESVQPPEMSPRRKFFRTIAGVGAGIAAAAAGLKTLAGRKAEAAALPPVLAESNGNLLVRMQRDLEQTLARGTTPSWLMVVDTRKCIGCDSCTVACRAENPAGPAGGFRRVIQLRFTPGPRPVSIFKPANCLQCDNPPCAQAVPEGMIRKRPDGIVEFDYGRLRGPYAAAAAAACPFNAIHVDDGRTFTQGTPAPQAYEERSFVENGVSCSRKPGANRLADTARKCTFCSHLLEAGVLPACVTTCIGGAMYFGDANNPSSLVNEITQGRRRFQGHDRRGVGPRVVYFEEPMPGASHMDCSVCHY